MRRPREDLTIADSASARNARALLLAAIAIATLVHTAPLQYPGMPKLSIDGSPRAVTVLYVQGL